MKGRREEGMGKEENERTNKRTNERTHRWFSFSLVVSSRPKQTKRTKQRRRSSPGNGRQQLKRLAPCPPAAPDRHPSVVSLSLSLSHSLSLSLLFSLVLSLPRPLLFLLSSLNCLKSALPPLFLPPAHIHNTTTQQQTHTVRKRLFDTED